MRKLQYVSSNIPPGVSGRSFLPVSSEFEIGERVQVLVAHLVILLLPFGRGLGRRRELLVLQVAVVRG